MAEEDRNYVRFLALTVQKVNVKIAETLDLHFLAIVGEFVQLYFGFALIEVCLRVPVFRKTLNVN
ncbi:hypothetical protein J1614_009355 [Plenodomus biglobosus]|nr:hypothetical protein J1614_009355 [Plenodomus biglobosus]